jgi:hypothetical protein
MAAKSATFLNKPAHNEPDCIEALVAYAAKGGVAMNEGAEEKLEFKRQRRAGMAAIAIAMLVYVVAKFGYEMGGSLAPCCRLRLFLGSRLICFGLHGRLRVHGTPWRAADNDLRPRLPKLASLFLCPFRKSLVSVATGLSVYIPHILVDPAAALSPHSQAENTESARRAGQEAAPTASQKQVVFQEKGKEHRNTWDGGLIHTGRSR